MPKKVQPEFTETQQFREEVVEHLEGTTEGIANLEELPKTLESAVDSSIQPEVGSPAWAETSNPDETIKDVRVDAAHPDRTKPLDPRPAAPKQVQRVYQAEALRHIRDAIVDLKASLRYLRPLDFEGEMKHPAEVVEGMVEHCESIKNQLLLARKNV